MDKNNNTKNSKPHPEWIALASLGVFTISLFLPSDEALKSTLQLTSISISGYFGYISHNEKEND